MVLLKNIISANTSAKNKTIMAIPNVPKQISFSMF